MTVGGEPHRFELEVTPRLAAFLDDQDIDLDFDRAMFVWDGGEASPFGDADARDPWHLRDPAHGLEGPPLEKLTMDLDDGAVQASFGVLRLDKTPRRRALRGADDLQGRGL